MRLWRGAVAAVAACISLYGVEAVPDGFNEREIVKGGRITDIVFLPNDDMMVTVKNGFVNVYSPDEGYGYGDKVEALDIESRVCENGERGLGGIQIHPNFEENNWVYVKCCLLRVYTIERIEFILIIAFSILCV
jgi:glucose/arabinose dehydrogenase